MWVASVPGPLLLFIHFPYQQPAPGSPCFGSPASCLCLNLPLISGSMPPSELVPTPLIFVFKTFWRSHLYVYAYGAVYA